MWNSLEGVDLSRYDQAYQSAAEPLPNVPDGRYEAMVEGAELTQAKSSGNPMIKYRLRLLDGVAQDRTVMKNRVITEKTVGYVRQELETLGLRLAKLSDLPDHIHEVLDRVVSVTVKTREGDQNVYFNRRETESAQVAAAGGDDLPF